MAGSIDRREVISKGARGSEGFFLPQEDEQLLDLLLNHGLISEDQRRVVMIERTLSGHPVESLLAELSFVTEAQLTHVLSHMRGSPNVSLKNIDIDLDLIKEVPRAIAEEHAFLPISRQKSPEGIVLAMADINDLHAFDIARKCFPSHYVVTPVMASRTEILAILSKDSVDLASLITPVGEDPTQIDDQSAIRFVHGILKEAIRQNASDVHLEPEHVFVRMRYRCDGILKTAFFFHQKAWSPICVRIKVMAGMDIAETRRPQDGRFSLTFSGRLVDFRVASHPSIHGENIVIRILDKTRSVITLDTLGYSEKHLCDIKRCLAKPEGIFIVTGPTGAGKTTSLYAMLQLLDATKLNIMTLEEPVEYRLPFIRQTEIREGGPISFVDGVRSILRQDPDVILVGEIRDKETAHMAIRAAMTGHLVLTTLHTNDALGAVYRFLDFEVPLSLLSGNLIGVVAQRLIRVLCQHCREPTELSPSEAQGYAIWPQTTVYQQKGCAKCTEGYLGRRAVSEVLAMDDDLEGLILDRAPYGAVRGFLEKKGFRCLMEEGMDLVLQGITTLDEIRRVIGL